MREKIRIKYFTVFIFLAILFLINTRTVFAKVGSANSEHSNAATIICAESIQSQSKNFLEIYASSTHYGEGHYTLGWKEDIMAGGINISLDGNGEFNEPTGNGVAFSSLNNLIAYPYIVLFSERWKNDKGVSCTKYSTGYLYLYVDNYQAKEQASIWAGYAGNDDNIENCYLPLYYQTSRSGGESKGEAFFGLSGYMTYLPISNIIDTDKNCYYGQNFNPDKGSDKHKNANDVLDRITNKGERKQDIDGWEVWNNGTGYLMGNLLTDEVAVISSNLKWVSMFAIGAMGENTYNEVGVSYHTAGDGGKEYKVKQADVQNGFDNFTADLTKNKGYTDAKKISSLVTSLITGNPDAIKVCGYHGFKDNYEYHGMDTYSKDIMNPGFPARSVSICNITGKDGKSRLYTDESGGRTLLKGGALLNSAKNILFGDSGNNYNILQKDRLRLTPSQFASSYNSIFSTAQGMNVNSNFININGGQFLSRYSWGATVGSIGACQDTWFPRDVKVSQEQNPSEIIIERGEMPGNSLGAKKSNPKTKNFGSYATDEWDSLTDDEKVTNTIIMLESFPWYVPLIAAKSKIGKVYKLGNGKDTVVNLNKLGADKKTFKDWKKCIIEMGDYLVSHTLTSVFPSTGWSAQSVFGSPDGTYYSVQTYPIFIALTPRTYTAEDLLISNSYGDATNTANLGGMAGTIHDATARNTIDWGGDPDLGSLTYQGLNVGSVMKKSEDGGYGNPAWDKKNRA